MHLDLIIVAVGLAVGIIVGLTGMGGGALLTPILVLGLGVPPLAAVSSDLMAAFFMKPVGGVVHLRRGTVDLRLVRWLVVGSVPAALLGVLSLRLLGDGEAVQEALKTALGIVLLVAAAAMLAKSLLVVFASSRGRFARLTAGPVKVRPVPTILIGVLGGYLVGITSVGSGSLMVVLLMLLYPGMTGRSLVGTDLVQAVPLVGAAALGHLLLGDFQLSLTASLLLGSLPGVYLGARISSRTSGTQVRRLMVFVLTGTGLKLLGTPIVDLATILLVLAAVALPVWISMRRIVTAWGRQAASRDLQEQTGR